MNHNDWRNKSNYDLWQKRRFLLSCFSRCEKTIKTDVYEFIDYLISQGYKAPLGSLTEVDDQVMRFYKEYLDHVT